MNIHDFAKSIGVSSTTVSRVLSGKGRISEQTRHYVLGKVEELGFVPDRNAQRLAKKRTKIIHFSGLDRGYSRDTDFFETDMVRSLIHGFKEHGYELLATYDSNLEEQTAAIKDKISSRAVDGVVLVEGELTSDITKLKSIAELGKPVVVIVQKPFEIASNVGSVIIDVSKPISQAFELLSEKGHQVVGFVDYGSKWDLYETIKEAAALASPNLKIVYFNSQGRRSEDGADALHHLIESADPPTAVYARTDILAIGVYREAQRMGMRIPQDLSIISHDDLPILQLAAPGISAIHLDTDEIARHTARLMMSLLDHVIEHPRSYIQVPLIIRDSIAKKNRMPVSDESVPV